MLMQLGGLIAGVVFGAGLVISSMIDPRKVLAFLDVTGNWDPSLVLVLGAAVTVNFVGYRLVLRRSEPIFGDRFALPTRTDLDPRLIGGSALFGIGWGLAGYCPGPALVAIGTASLEAIVFCAALFAGFITVDLADNFREAQKSPATDG